MKVLVALNVLVLLKMFAPENVLLLARSVVDAPVNVAWLCQYAADVVENASPWLAPRK